MKDDSIQIKQKDGYVTRVHPFYAEGEPVASVLVFHGAAEYHERYKGFAAFLNAHGYDVYLYDHRGHGKDCKIDELGFTAAKDGDRVLTDDAINVANEIKGKIRTKDLFLFGHSMGSFICRIVFQTVDDVKGAVVMGTNFDRSPVTSAGLLVTKLICIFKGADHKSPFCNKLAFQSKPYLSLAGRTIMDWLSRDNAEVGKYISDPYCGFICSASYYHDLIKLIRRAAHKKNILNTRKDFPMFIISGDKDPVGAFGKQVDELTVFLKKHGFTDVTEKLYPECRHELLNEINKQEVYDDILLWLNSKL